MPRAKANAGQMISQEWIAQYRGFKDDGKIKELQTCTSLIG